MYSFEIWSMYEKEFIVLLSELLYLELNLVGLIISRKQPSSLKVFI